jgi:PAS domain S-box-containing protein
MNLATKLLAAHAAETEEVRTRRALLHMLEDLQREQEAIRKARHDWIETVDALGDLVMVHDAELRVVRCNRAYAAHAGMAFAEILGRPYWQCFPKRSSPLEACLLPIEAGARGVHETEFTLQTGEIFVSRAYAIGAGAGMHVLHLFENVTQKRRAERALSVSEERFRSMFEQAAVGVLQTSLDGTLLKINPAFCAMLGYSEAELVGRHFRELTHTEDRETSEAVARSLAAQGTDTSQSVFEKRYLRKDGSAIWASVAVSAVRNEKGDTQYFVALVQDINERRLAEQKLHFTNALLLTQQETSLDGIYVVDDNRKMISCNRRFVEMWGIPAEVMETRSDDVAIRSVLANFESPDDFLHGVRQLYANKDLEVRDELHLKGGKTFERFSSSMTGADGTHYGRVFYFRDISQRKAMAKALLESEEKFRAIFDHLVDGIVVMNLELRDVKFANSGMERLLRYGTGGLVGLSLSRLHPQEALAEIGERFTSGAKGHLRFVQDMPLLAKTGDVVYADLAGAPVEFGGQRYLLGAFRDATERRAKEARLRAQLDELQRWQQLSLDREDRVIELKGEVNDLLARLREQPRYASTL